MTRISAVFRPAVMVLVLALCRPALAVNPLAPYGLNQGESHVNEDHQGQSLIYDNISGGNINGGNFSYADLTGANLNNTSHYDVNFRYAVLRGADLSGGYGVQVDYSYADCTGANLSAGDSYWDIFNYTNLTNAKLDTYLDGVPFAGSILTGTDFGGSDLYTTDFRNTNLSGAIFTNAGRLDQAVFGSTLYDAHTVFPAGFNPSSYGLVLTPEPSTLVLLASGLCLLGYARRRGIRAK